MTEVVGWWCLAGLALFRGTTNLLETMRCNMKTLARLSHQSATGGWLVSMVAVGAMPALSCIEHGRKEVGSLAFARLRRPSKHINGTG